MESKYVFTSNMLALHSFERDLDGEGCNSSVIIANPNTEEVFDAEGCKRMLVAGIQWIERNPKAPILYTGAIKGRPTDGRPFGELLHEMRRVCTTYTGEMLRAASTHALFAKRSGGTWEAYCEGSRRVYMEKYPLESLAATLVATSQTQKEG